MPDDQLQYAIERFWDTIPPVWGTVRGIARTSAVQDHNISLVQFHILRHIRRGARSVSDLAELLQVSRPAVSQALEELVEKDLVSRREDPHDRRFVDLSLTGSGNQLLNAVFGKNRQWMAEKMAGLGPEELETLIRALDILKKTFDSSSGS